ncbi:PREDICTED: serine protease snake-like isoform X1 [Vollenhovia emeryi]|uniref:serine protease snake-like isoform X1 n=1 Tax=Vollenhovia emeryi TaxID=411798 RepID=UPI0005F4C0B2|nr:PREDICTED: serine protease snake-like isoform X1 [Vollenhovia emeryi]XP_011879471.1 PREDICTED: serine protease snake-like isoform X1 [Vollenhovia emeryi]
MNFGFVPVVVIFLTLDVVPVRFTDGSSEKYLVELSPNISQNPFLQFVTSTSAQNNNKLGNLLSHSSPSHAPSQAPPNAAHSNGNYFFPNNPKNPFLNPPGTTPKLDVQPPPRPVTQKSYVPLHQDFYFPQDNIISVFTPAPVYNDITMSRTHSPPQGGGHPPGYSPSSSILSADTRPSLADLISYPRNAEKSISEFKCAEYAGELAGTTLISYLVSSGQLSPTLRLNNVCDKANHLVVGGTEALVSEFPHMVALGRPSSKFIVMCGGTLISHTWVLSAAHCTFGPEDGFPTHAKIGFHNVTDKNAIITAIKNTIRHPQYDPPKMYADIALVQLTDKVTFAYKSIRPACLYQVYDPVPEKAWVSGWGRTEYVGNISDVLLTAELNIVDNLECTRKYNSSLEIPEGIKPSMICAGDPSGKKDSCQGDSGGPLQIIHPDKCFFQVVGIVSFGQPCGLTTIPAVYTKVSHYITWIESIVWPRGQ